VDADDRAIDKNIFKVGITRYSLEKSLKHTALGPSAEPPKHTVPFAKSWWEISPGTANANLPQHRFKK
jgi:hypothetical protein